MPLKVASIRRTPMEGPVRLSESEVVTDIPLFVIATMRQVVARLAGKDWLAGNRPLEELLRRLAAVGCIVEMEEDEAPETSGTQKGLDKS